MRYCVELAVFTLGRMCLMASVWKNGIKCYGNSGQSLTELGLIEVNNIG